MFIAGSFLGGSGTICAPPSHPRGTAQIIDSGCRSIQPTDLPEAYRVPAELSEALHELGEKDTEAIDKPFYGAAGYSVGLLRMAFPGSHHRQNTGCQ